MSRRSTPRAVHGRVLGSVLGLALAASAIGVAGAASTADAGPPTAEVAAADGPADPGDLTPLAPSPAAELTPTSGTVPAPAAGADPAPAAGMSTAPAAVGTIPAPTAGGSPAPAAGVTDDGPTATVSDPRPLREEEVTVIGTGFSPDEKVTAELPARLRGQLGSAVAGPDGTVSIPVRAPTALQAGAHEVVLRGSSGTTASTSVQLRPLVEDQLARLARWWPRG